MTHTSTEQERAEFERELIDNHHYVPSDFSFKDGFYGGDDDYIQFGWDLWQAARRAPVVSSRPTVDQVSDAIGYHSSGWDCANPDELIDVVLRLSAAPQPPEAAPVELPEPVYTMRVRGRMHDYTPTLSAFDLADGEHELYTEQQVRQLLAAHGVK